jgi:hypothetical protein
MCTLDFKTHFKLVEFLGIRTGIRHAELWPLSLFGLRVSESVTARAEARLQKRLVPGPEYLRLSHGHWHRGSAGPILPGQAWPPTGPSESAGPAAFRPAGRAAPERRGRDEP